MLFGPRQNGVLRAERGVRPTLVDIIMPMMSGLGSGHKRGPDKMVSPAHHWRMRVDEQSFRDALSDELSRRLGRSLTVNATRPVAGGCIHDACRAELSSGDALFVKRGDERARPLFAAEAEGLDALADAKALRVPRPVAHGIAGGWSYLATEFVELGPRGDDAAFGAALARLHATTADTFGAARDNWIGTTVQPNGWYRDWIAFWRDQRLGHQLGLAAGDGHVRLAERGERLLEGLDGLFAGHDPAPSLLHGDLWAGNSVVFDPAAYHGDREADLAMTRLFGGFADEFHRAYADAWPLDAGHETRGRLYNLYHLLNHAHLFGGGYARQAGSVIEELLAELSG